MTVITQTSSENPYVVDLFLVQGGERHEYILVGDGNHDDSIETDLTRSRYGETLLPPDITYRLPVGAIRKADPVVEFREMMIHELFLKDELQLKDGYLDKSTAPGLGMALNDEKVEALRTPGMDV